MDNRSDNLDCKTIWSDQIPRKDDIKSTVNDVAFSPDGAIIIAAVRNRVLLYNALDGTLLESLLGHKDTVKTLDFSWDGSRFASGGADNVVVLWKKTGEGILKYTHSAPIQRLKFHPNALKLVSCSDVDYGIWSHDQKVMKEKESSKIISVCWSSDGHLFAIGMLSGIISIRNSLGEEVQRIERRTSADCLVFIPNAIQVGKGSQIPGQNQPQAAGGDGETLLVGSWDKTLSFYIVQATGHKLLTEKPLKFYPTNFTLSSHQGKKGNSFVMTGSNGKCSLYSKEGLCLHDIGHKDSWIWSSAYNASTNRVVYGTDNGDIEVKQINFDNVFATHNDKYAYQENLTEVIIHSYSTDKKVRIKCKDFIHKLSLYNNKLGIQLSDRICIYESNIEDVYDLHFHLRRERINIVDKTITDMLITSSHLIFIKNQTIELYTYDCIRQRTWMLESPSTYAKVVGGPGGQEMILIGCQNGNIYKLFIDNPFLVDIGKRSSAIVTMDLNDNLSKLLTIDSLKNLVVMDMKSQQVVYTASNAVYGVFNIEIDNLLCYASSDHIAQIVTITTTTTTTTTNTANNDINGNTTTTTTTNSLTKTLLKPIHQSFELLLPGKLISFQGQKIFCQDKYSLLLNIDVPQSNNISKSILQNDYIGAYKISCLGATEKDWKLLGMKALRNNYLLIAKKAFSKIKDIKYLNLIDMISKSSTNGGGGTRTNVSATSMNTVTTTATRRGTSTATINDNTAVLTAGGTGTTSSTQSTLDSTWLAEILAYEGYHLEAAKMYTRIGKVDEALRILIDLCKWDDAKLFAQSAGYDQSYQSELIYKQAQWLHEINDWKGAAELYISLGRYMKGVQIVGNALEEGWDIFLIDIVRRTPADSELEALIYCADKFESSNKYDYAKETIIKIGDITKLMSLYIRRQLWTEAALLAESNQGKFDVTVFLPYADWLVSQGRYEESYTAYIKANRKDKGIHILNELLKNCTKENRFKDAAYYAYTISKDCDDVIDQNEWKLKADCYYAYSTIYSFICDPFTQYQSETLFQVSRYLLNILSLLTCIPYGISEASILYTLGRESMSLKAYKLARQVYDKLIKLQLASTKMEEVELNILIIQSKPVRDDPDILPVCYRCSSTNPLLNPFTEKFVGDVCTNCGHPFMRSLINFDILPLVEFIPHSNISDEDAILYIQQSASSSKTASNNDQKSSNRDSKWNEKRQGNTDRLTLDDDGEDHSRSNSYSLDDMKGDNENGDNELFTKCINRTLDKQSNKEYMPVVVDMKTLISLNHSEVYMTRNTNKNERCKFYKNMLPDIAIAVSQPCQKFFHLEDFEFAYLTEKKCPYSRIKNIGNYGSL